MNQLRQDRTTGGWVIIAPGRGRRPLAPSGGGARQPLLAVDADCPFCPGNEHRLPSIIDQTDAPAPPGWCTRVVPNKYPAVCDDTHAVGASGAVLPAYGFHEVIIESPRHDLDLVTLAGDDRIAVIRTGVRRWRELAARPRIASVLWFRNRGARAGASLAHPHSQLVATAHVPARLAALAPQAGNQCPLCAEIARELDDGRRIVETCGRFVRLVPFAATSPLEQWILPRRHDDPFGELDEEGCKALARALHDALRGVQAVLNDPPYNCVVESAPGEAGHWRLRIVPQVVTAGGFELGAGLPINPSLPESDAQALRAAASRPAS